jgi:hypothetical protein
MGKIALVAVADRYILKGAKPADLPVVQATKFERSSTPRSLGYLAQCAPRLCSRFADVVIN